MNVTRTTNKQMNSYEHSKCNTSSYSHKFKMKQWNTADNLDFSPLISMIWIMLHMNIKLKLAEEKHVLTRAVSRRQ